MTRYLLARGSRDLPFPLPLLVRLTLLVVRLRWRCRVDGVLPPGGAVLVSRHTSYWDGLLAAALDPRVVPVVGSDWRRPAVLGRFLTRYGALWTDAAPVEAGRAVVAAGGVVWIAPAGWERDAPGRVRRGAAEIAGATGAPVVLLALDGVEERGRRRARLDVSLRELVPAGSTPDQVQAALEDALG